MRRLGRAAIDALLVAALGVTVVPLAYTLGAFSATTSSPANSFANLQVAPAALAPAIVAGATVRLGWSASATASTESVAYEVRRRVVGGAYVPIAVTGGVTYDDGPGDGSWEYVIRAIVATFTADSNAVIASMDGTPPTAATNVTATTGTANGTVDLVWTAATDGGSGVSGYTIRYVQASTCPAVSASAYPSALSVGAVASWTVTGLARNRSYCFSLITSDGAGNPSGPSNAAAAKAK